jgi:hypothetical protein
MEKSIDLQNKISKMVIKSPQEYVEDIEKIDKEVKNSKAVYKGEPVPYLYIPRIFNNEDVKNFKEMTKNIFKIINKTIKLFLEEKEVRDLYNFDKNLEEMIKAPHYYDVNVPMGRFDIFYYGEDYKFCELNADGSSAMNEEMELSRILKDSKVVKGLKKYNMKQFELFDSWINEVEEIFEEYKKNKEEEFKEKEDTNIAIVDFLDRTTPVEIEVFKQHFNNRGYNCYIVDPRNITYKDGELYNEDKKIDIIYRRLVTKDLMERYDQVQDLVKGILAGNTCIIGPIKSQIIHTKKFFQILHNDLFRKYLDEDELEYIDKHIPYTKELKKNKKWEDYIEDKDKYIIKPVDYYASKGVYSGRDYSKKQWEVILKEKVEEDYLIQEYCSEAYISNIFLENGKIKYNTFNNINGIFIYNEKFKGIYTRAGMKSIISGLHDGYSMSSLLLEEK